MIHSKLLSYLLAIESLDELSDSVCAIVGFLLFFHKFSALLSERNILVIGFSVDD